MRIRSVLEFSFGTLASRVLGFVREIVFAYALGSTQYADAIIVAIRIPTMLRGILAEGISQNAFLPIITRWKDGRLLWALISIIMSFTTLTVIFGILLSDEILVLTTPGFLKDQEKFDFTDMAMKLSFPSMIFISATAIQMGILSSRGRFFLSGFSSTIFNLGMILVLFFAKDRPILGAVSFLFGCALQFLFLLPFSYEGFERPNFRHEAIRDFLKNWLSVALNSGFLHISTFINTVIASFLPTGSLAYLNYAFRMIQLPQGLIGVSTATVVSKEVSENEGKAMGTLKRAVMFSSAFSLFFVLVFTFFGYEIVEVFFTRGRFTPSDAINTYKAMLGYLLAIPSFVYSSIIISFLFATFRRREANLGFLLSTIVNAFISPIMAKILGFVGIALAVSLAQSSSVIFWAYGIFKTDRWFFTILSIMLFSALLSFVFLFFNLRIFS